jgi:NADH-quinone oxidoreductase subunit L
MIELLVVFPLVAAAILSLLFRNSPRAVKYIALVAALATLALAALIFVSPNAPQSFQWFSLGNLAFNISTTAAPINLMLLMLVSVITPLIFLYSLGFMTVPTEQARFYFEMCVFAAAMILFAISANFITMFIAWEMLGLTSYMLIGFWYKKEHAPTAARKAITTILIGDILMLIGILLIGATYGTFEFSTILATPASPSLTIALVFILFAAFTKSAQFPFHEWLSDAMEGPTPVSAFLHSSTMVKAGVFLIAVLLPLYVSANLLPVILAIGLVSALIGVSNALTDRHIKKILAYSTIEDLGLMFVALGLGSLPAAIALFFVQTFYKALLFMSAGAIMKANDDKEDIYKIYGASLNRYLFAAMAIGVLSIAGIFPLSGFFGKAMVESAAMPNIIAYTLILIVELGTGLYIFRWMFVVSRKSYEQSSMLKLNYGSIPKSMTAPMYMLAAAVIVASVAYLYLPGYTNGSSSGINIANIATGFVGMFASIIGIVIAYRVYAQGHRLHLASTSPNLFSAVHNSVVTNAFYSRVTRSFAYAGGLVGYNDFAFDKVTYGFAQALISTGNLIRRVENGQTNTYLLGFVIGMTVLLLAFIL